ncbi:MAG: four helix bundle protein [Ignavibacteriota bacterium]
MAEYDLEERTFQFAKSVCLFMKSIPKTISNVEYSKQVIRSSSSVGANYIEANESLGKKDFVMHLRISRKEAKESIFWLRLISETNDEIYRNKCNDLILEATELKKIFSAIIEKSK